MKALTLTQPWAALVALGQKRVETRSWRTSYRGPLAIHAGRLFPGWAREISQREPFLSALRPCGVPADLHASLGHVLCTVRLVSCLKAETAARMIPSLEQQFGDYGPGRFAWFLEDPEPVIGIPLATGHLGLWEWDG